MSISSIGSTAAAASASTNPFQQERQDFLALEQAISSGNLAGAQSVFANLQQTLQSTNGIASGPAPTVAPTAATTTAVPASGSVIQNDVTALSTALSTNNLPAAQAALQQLQTDLKSQTGGRGHHHHHHGGGALASLLSGIRSPSTATPTSTTGSQLNTTA